MNEQLITVNLPLAWFNYIRELAAEKPYKEVAPLIAELDRQISPQVAALNTNEKKD